MDVVLEYLLLFHQLLDHVGLQVLRELLVVDGEQLHVVVLGADGELVHLLLKRLNGDQQGFSELVEAWLNLLVVQQLHQDLHVLVSPLLFYQYLQSYDPVLLGVISEQLQVRSYRVERRLVHDQLQSGLDLQLYAGNLRLVPLLPLQWGWQGQRRSSVAKGRFLNRLVVLRLLGEHHLKQLLPLVGTLARVLGGVHIPKGL